MGQAAEDLLAQLDGLSAPQRAALAGLAAGFSVPAGAAIFRQHDQSDGLYLINDGAVVVTGRTPGDGHVELARLGAGAMLGEFCLLDGGRRSADALAASDCAGWRLDLARFAGLQDAGDAAALALAAALRAQVAARSRDLVTALAGSTAVAGPAPVGVAAAADHLAARLHTFPGFDLFSPADWQALATAGHSHQYRRGQRLDGGPPLLWIVLRGAVQWKSGGGLQLLVHGPGALAGSAAFVAGQPWPAQLLVREDAELFALPALPDGATGQKLARMLGAALVRDQRRLTRVRARLSAMAAA
jgi:CRP-like cAMP-binding protein